MCVLTDLDHCVYCWLTNSSCVNEINHDDNNYVYWPINHDNCVLADQIWLVCINLQIMTVMFFDRQKVAFVIILIALCTEWLILLYQIITIRYAQIRLTKQWQSFNCMHCFKINLLCFLCYFLTKNLLGCFYALLLTLIMMC